MPDWDLFSALKDIKSGIDKLLASSKTFSLESLDELRKKDPEKADGLLATHIGGLSERRQDNIFNAARTLRSDGASNLENKHGRDQETKMDKHRIWDMRQRELRDKRQRELERKEEERRREKEKRMEEERRWRIGRHNRQPWFPY